MNKYFFLSAFFVWSAVYAAEPEQKKRVHDGLTLMKELFDDNSVRYSAYGITQKLFINRYRDDNLLKGKVLTSIGLIPHTSWAIIGTHSGVIALNIQNQSSGIFVDHADCQEFSGALSSSIACASRRNIMAYAVSKHMAVGTFTPLHASKYRYTLSFFPVDSLINVVAFDPTDSIIAGGCDDGLVRIWDIQRTKHPIKISMARAATTPRETPIYALAYLDNHTICYNSPSRGIVIHDIRSKENNVFEDQHTGLVRALAASITSKRIISGGADGMVHLYDARSPKVLEKLSLATKSPVTCVALHPSFTEEFWTGQEDGACWLSRSTVNDKVITRYGDAAAHAASVNALAVSAYTQDYCAASVGGDGVVNFYGSAIKSAQKKSEQEKSGAGEAQESEAAS